LKPSKRNESLKDQLEIDALFALDRIDELRPRLEKRLEAQPDDDNTIRRLAIVYQKLDPPRAIEFASEKLREGHSLPVLAEIFVGEDPHWLKRAKELIAQVDPASQPSIIEAFDAVPFPPEVANTYIAFLRWATKKFPQLTHLRIRLATQLHMQCKDEEAQKVAKKLFNEDPQDPERIYLMGVCLQDTSPAESVKYLEQEYQITGSAMTLGRLARGYQLMRQDKKAQQCYHETLAINPHDTLAMTNLVYRYGVQDAAMFDKICNAIRLGYGQGVQYFHVIAVQVALKQKGVLPPEWLTGALERYEAMKIEGPFADEDKRLSKAILAFAMKNDLRDLVQQFGTWSTRLSARWHWPRLRWVPILPKRDSQPQIG